MTFKFTFILFSVLALSFQAFAQDSDPIYKATIDKSVCEIARTGNTWDAPCTSPWSGKLSVTVQIDQLVSTTTVKPIVQPVVDVDTPGIPGSCSYEYEGKVGRVTVIVKDEKGKILGTSTEDLIAKGEFPSTMNADMSCAPVPQTRPTLTLIVDQRLRTPIADESAGSDRLLNLDLYLDPMSIDGASAPADGESGAYNVVNVKLGTLKGLTWRLYPQGVSDDGIFLRKFSRGSLKF